MKLKNNLFSILGSEPTVKGVSYRLRLNPDCIIYKAHFPEHPVTPGVCIIEIAHELLEEYYQCQMPIKTVKNVKFLSVISPVEVQEINCELTVKEDEDVKVQATVVDGETAFAKISIICQK